MAWLRSPAAALFPSKSCCPQAAWAALVSNTQAPHWFFCANTATLSIQQRGHASAAAAAAPTSSSSSSGGGAADTAEQQQQQQQAHPSSPPLYAACVLERLPVGHTEDGAMASLCSQLPPLLTHPSPPPSLSVFVCILMYMNVHQQKQIIKSPPPAWEAEYKAWLQLQQLRHNQLKQYPVFDAKQQQRDAGGGGKVSSTS